MNVNIKSINESEQGVDLSFASKSTDSDHVFRNLYGFADTGSDYND